MIARSCCRPDRVEAYASRGLIVADQQRHEEALASYDKAIALDPNHAQANSITAFACWRWDVSKPDGGSTNGGQAAGFALPSRGRIGEVRRTSPARRCSSIGSRVWGIR